MAVKQALLDLDPVTDPRGNIVGSRRMGELTQSETELLNLAKINPEMQRIWKTKAWPRRMKQMFSPVGSELEGQLRNRWTQEF